MNSSGRSVAAVAGRRIDAPNTSASSFAPGAIGRVMAEVKRLFARHNVEAVVASAACGADIVALEAARARGIRIRIVLPFSSARFRQTSVIDRGEEWGPRYDALIEDAKRLGDLVVLEQGNQDDDNAAYGAATARIIQEALALSHAASAKPLAIAIWDERPRETNDATKDFLDQASRAGFDCQSISTTDDNGFHHG
jgi:hypothetical protein